MRHAAAEPPRLGRSPVFTTTGCLIVVSSSDQPALDLLLTAVRRRMPGTTLEFPRRITTRRSGSLDAEIAVTRSLFREIERDGAFVAQWEADGHRFGLPVSVRELLMGGRSAVIAAPAGIIADLQETCPDVRVLRLAGRLDAARAALSPRACLRRIVGRRVATRLEARTVAPTTNALSPPGDLPSAVRILTDALVTIEQEHAGFAPAPCGLRDRLRRGRHSPVSSAHLNRLT